jgi:hypothetical protein
MVKQKGWPYSGAQGSDHPNYIPGLKGEQKKTRKAYGGDVKVDGKKASSRLDKRARGGGVKKKPDVKVSVLNVRAPVRRRGFQLGGAAPIAAGRPPIAAARPVGLPAQANPAAAAALAARPALPVQAQGVRPFNRGGRW